MNPGKHKKGGWVDPLLRPVPVSSVPSAGLDSVVEPTGAERAAMAAALGLDSVERLRATYRLTPRAGGQIAVAGELEALARPVCVVTLEPFDLAIREKVELRFAEADSAPAETDIEYSSADDPPDPIEDGVIDLGKVTTEFLSLAIPAFPRKADAVFAGGDGEKGASPFAALAKLKRQDG
jgi:hypothetical protein